MSPQANSRTQLAPDKASLTESQASVLGSLTGIDASKLKGLSVAEISSEFRWRIDPNLLLFTRVCGQVVKQDPVSGQQYPVLRVLPHRPPLDLVLPLPLPHRGGCPDHNRCLRQLLHLGAALHDRVDSAFPH